VLSDLSGSVQTIQQRHPDIDDDQIRFEPGRFRNHGTAVGYDPEHRVLFFEQNAKRFGEDCVIIRDQEARA
jgi:hypothetical protein